MKLYRCDNCGKKFRGELECDGDIPYCPECEEAYETRRRAIEVACEHVWGELVDSHTGEPAHTRRCDKCWKQEWRPSQTIYGDY